MKTRFMLLAVSFLFLSGLSFSQAPEKNQKKIEVTGSAEIEVVPDELYFVIALREYVNDSRNKISIEKLENDLQKAVKDAGIPNENFRVENVFGYNWEWEKKKKDKDFMARKSFRLKLSDLNKINQILSKLDSRGIESMNIVDYSHSKMEQYRKELKIKALQAAKEKATYLLASIGEEIGGVLEVSEMGDHFNPPVPMYRGANYMKAEAMDEAMAEPIDFKNIKLRYEMRAVFAIK